MNGWMDRQLRSKTAKIHKMKVWMGEKQYTQQTSHWISLDRQAERQIGWMGGWMEQWRPAVLINISPTRMNEWMGERRIDRWNNDDKMEGWMDEKLSTNHTSQWISRDRQTG